MVWCLLSTHLVGVREAEVESATLVPLATDAEASAHAEARHGDGDASLRLIILRHETGTDEGATCEDGEASGWAEQYIAFN